ncbi:peptidase [Lactobacillus crispatus]|uniref:peptidase n=1 Tax=Lactobacillus crispatus TaxID=47770 RepID=UPI0028EB2FB4|nr:peptidase [Lactobacillus crispatus]MDT9604498.1 peptidase [Lactobacillus crispatus]MDX5062336.1 peptidase [Lactobacillus crispatus]MDX5074464.1 peptidase [Lactobacillus crispatus]MDX5077829.1 peptidase [Lactobacillus crispatus]MDX5089385.1 peptidase [Lactobacillus crispatus]
MKKLLIGSAVLAALLIKENIAVNAAIEQNETTPKIAVTDKKEKPKDQSDNSLAGHYDQETNFITWEIRLNPKKEKYTGDLKLENLIPEGLVLDPDTIEVIKNDNFIQNSSLVKLKKNKLTAEFPAKKYSESTILIKYRTKVEAEPNEPNYLRVSQSFTLGDDRVQEYEQEIKYDRSNKNFNIEAPHKSTFRDDNQISLIKKSKNNEERSEDWLKRLAELIINKKETTSDKGGEKVQGQVKDQKQQASPENTNLSHTPTVKGLTGFDTKANEVKSTAKIDSDSVKTTLDKDEIKDNASTISPKSQKHDTHVTLPKSDTSETKAKLPKAGETAGVMLSVLGIILIIAGWTVRTKFLK